MGTATDKDKPANLTVKEVAAELRVTTTTIYELCRAGMIRCLRVGVGRGRIIVPREALTEYEAESGRIPAPVSVPLNHLADRPSSAPRPGAGSPRARRAGGRASS
jgi:excisionase family DNA binding protein